MRRPSEAIRSAARRLPRPLRDRAKSARSSYRSARYRTRERIRPTRLDGADVERALRAAGLTEGDTLFLQAKMSAFGSFERGPDAVLEAIDRVVGPEGLVAMPTITMAEPAIEYLARDPIFDVYETPSRLGAISERFRLSPGTLRSVHPTHPVAARGPGAEEIVAGHETAETPFGEGTPYLRLIERNALQIYFGCGPAALTMYHPFEVTRVPPFPLDVFADRVFDVRCIGRRGEEMLVRTLVHDPELLKMRIDVNRGLEERFRVSFIDRAGARAIELGRGEVLGLRLQPMLEDFERLLGEGVTMYAADVPDVQPSVPPQDRVRG